MTRKTCHVTSSGQRLAVNSDLKLSIVLIVHTARDVGNGGIPGRFEERTGGS